MDYVSGNICIEVERIDDGWLIEVERDCSKILDRSKGCTTTGPRMETRWHATTPQAICDRIDEILTSEYEGHWKWQMKDD